MRIRGVLARIGLALGAVATLLGVLELAAWALGQKPLAGQTAFQMRGATIACRFDPAPLAKLCDPERLRAEQDDGRTTVYVLGGSSVAGYQNPRRNIPHSLRQRLDTLQPDAWWVHSLARGCKDSVYLRRCALRALENDPDVLVIYAGHNDFSGHTGPHPRISLWMGEYGYPLFRLEHALGRTRFWTLLSTRGSGHADLDRDPAGQLSPEQARRAREVVLASYLRNVTRVIEEAAERDARVVLVTVVSNLYEFPERRSRWDAVLADADKAGASASPWLAHYTEGIRAARADRHAEALAAFARARDDQPLTRAPGLLNPALRELAAAHANVLLVDFERELEALGLREGIGCNFFGSESYCDGLHPNVRTSQRIGRAVADALLAQRLHGDG